MTTHTNEPRLWLQDLTGDRKPQELAQIACATCRHAMWHQIHGRVKPVAFCRMMHRETYNGDEGTFIEMCDGRLEADMEDLSETA